MQQLNRLLAATARRALKRCRSALRPCRPAAGRAVMFHIGRCGSSVLGDLMAQHPMVRWYGEIFERCKLSRAPVGIQPLLDSQCCRYPVAGWEIKFLRAQHLRVIGLDLGALVDALTAIGVRHFIILERRNLLRRMVSHVVAGHTHRYQQWHDAPSPTRIMLDLDRITIKGETRPLMDWFGRIDEEYARLRGLLERQCLLELSYEDDVERDPCRGFERMCGFLELSVPSNTDVGMRRMNPFDCLRSLPTGTKSLVIWGERAMRKFQNPSGTNCG